MTRIEVKTGERGSWKTCTVTPTKLGFTLKVCGPRQFVRGRELVCILPHGKDGIDLALDMLGEQPALRLARHPELRALARMILAGGVDAEETDGDSRGCHDVSGTKPPATGRAGNSGNGAGPE